MIKLPRRTLIVAVLAVVILVSGFAFAAMSCKSSNDKPDEGTGVGPVFDKAIELALETPEPAQAVQYTVTALNQLIPYGTISLPDEEVPGSTEAYAAFKDGLDRVTEVTDHWALDEEIGGTMLSIEGFLFQLDGLTDALSEQLVTVDPNVWPGFGTWQFENPGILQNWLYPRGWELREEPQELVLIEAIPPEGAVVVIKEVKGVKFELVRAPIFTPVLWPWNPIPNIWTTTDPYAPAGPWEPIVPSYYLWQIRLVPAEFIKTITYVHYVDDVTGLPKVEKTVDIEVILEPELRDFWEFFCPACCCGQKTGED